MPITSVSVTMVTEAFVDGAAQVPQKYKAAFRTRTDDVASIREAANYGISTMTEWPSGDLPQARVHTLGAKTVNYVEWGLQARVRKRNAKDDPGLLTEVVKAVGRAVESTKAMICATLVNGIFSTTTVIPGTKALCATDHPLANGGTRSNKLTSVPDLAGIFLGINLARNWKDYDGNEHDLAEFGWNLLHPTAAGLELSIAQALGSAVTSDQNQVNTAGSYGITQIPWSRITDTTHWSMYSKAVQPLVWWERDSVEDTIDIDEDSREIKISADAAWVAYCRGQPTGAIGSDA